MIPDYPPMVLDPSGRGNGGDGSVVVDSEVAFLEAVAGKVQLWVQGEDLCSWACELCRSWGVEPRTLLTPLQQVCEVVPSALHAAIGALSEGRLRSLHEKVLISSACPQTMGELLALLTEDPMWVGRPGIEHAARFLSHGVEGQEDLQSLIRRVKEEWRQAALRESPGLSELYAVSESDRASLVDSWMGIGAAFRQREELGGYPLPLSEELNSRFLAFWQERLRRDQGTAIDDLIPSALPMGSYETLCRSIGRYLLSNPRCITAERLAKIRRGLEADEFGKLAGLVPPSTPHAPSADWSTEEMVAWATDSYLPFRQWQVRYAPERSGESHDLAIKFARWLIEQYPSLKEVAVERSPLNLRVFEEVRTLVESGNAVLWVVIDGLGYQSHVALLRLLTEKRRQLHLQRSYATISVLPTDTKYAKWSLLRGVLPRYYEDGPDCCRSGFNSAWKEAGLYATQTASEFTTLKAALEAGERKLFCWDTTELDKCYHDVVDADQLRMRAHGVLDTLSQEILHLVDSYRDRARLSVVICGDHGQVLEAMYPRAMEDSELSPRGRMVTGTVDDPAGETVLLDRHQFGLPRDVTVVLGPQYLRAGRRDRDGRASGVHGGLFPEEVVLRVSVLNWNEHREPVIARVGGSGRPGCPGTVHVEIDNPNEVELRDLVLYVNEIPSLRLGLLLGNRVGAQRVVASAPIPVGEWPTLGEEEVSVTGRLCFSYGGVECGEAAICGKLKELSLYRDQGPSLDF